MSGQVLVGQSGDARIGDGKTAEEFPVLNPSATELYFSRPDFKNNQGRDNAADIWMRTRASNGRWNRAINVGNPVNSARADRPLGFSADGNRLAVLRGNSDLELVVLQKDGRSWKVWARTQVPNTVASNRDVAYNLATGELIYSAGEGTNAKNLHSTKLDDRGQWSSPSPIAELNTKTDETRPFFAPDGRTLYFFRAGQGWFRQADRGAEVTQTRVPINCQQFAICLNAAARSQEAVVSIAPTANTRELRRMAVAAEDYPALGRVMDASTANGRLALTSGVTLQQIVEPGNHTSVFLRNEERIVDGEELTDLDLVGIPVGGVFGSGGGDAPSTSQRIDRINGRISEYESELSTLTDRRQAILNRAEWDKIVAYEALVARDTIPKNEAELRRQEEQMKEIEAMKAKFNRQQTERQRVADGGSRRRIQYDRPEGETPAPSAPTSDLDEGLAASGLVPKGGIAPYRPSQELAEIRERQRQDSLNRGRGLNRPASATYGYDRNATQSWEYDLQRTLPSNQAAIAEAARIDEQYQRQHSEVEALRAELARLQGQRYINRDTRNAAPAPNNYGSGGYTPPAKDYEPAGQERWTARGGDPAPSNYGNASRGGQRFNERSSRRQTSTYRPAGTGPGEVIGISFVANTAYITGEGYGGIEQLYRIIQQAKGAVEVRIHTPADMDRRAAQLLSEERAKTIHLELTDRGIADRHFQILGFGNNETGKGGERVEVR